MKILIELLMKVKVDPLFYLFLLVFLLENALKCCFFSQEIWPFLSRLVLKKSLF